MPTRAIIRFQGRETANLPRRLGAWTSDVTTAMLGQARSNVREAGQYLASELRKTLTGERSGHRRKVPGTASTYYTASAPGEPPAVQLGNLRRSISVRDRGEPRSGVFAVLVGPRRLEDDYPARLELERNRPYVEPTLARSRRRLRRILEDGWE